MLDEVKKPTPAIIVIGLTLGLLIGGGMITYLQLALIFLIEELRQSVKDARVNKVEKPEPITRRWDNQDDSDTERRELRRRLGDINNYILSPRERDHEDLEPNQDPEEIVDETKEKLEACKTREEVEEEVKKAVDELNTQLEELRLEVRREISLEQKKWSVMQIMLL